MSPQEHLKLTREELHKLVWIKPMTEVAKNFEISDVAMAKLCARQQVPVPPRGYWARKAAGQDVPVPPLPEFVARPVKEQQPEPTPASAQKPAKKPKPGSYFEERNQKIKKSIKELRSVLSEAVDYTVRIDSWNCDYSFGLNWFYDPLRRDDDSSLHESPLCEDRDLILKGIVLAPRKVRDRNFEARLMRRAHLNQNVFEENLHRYEEEPSLYIGNFHSEGKRLLMAYVPIPDDAFALIIQNAAANKINFMTLQGEELRYGRGHIYRYSLQEKEDEEPT